MGEIMGSGGVIAQTIQLALAPVFVLVAIGLLMAALMLFMRETRHATAVLRIPETYLERERKL